MDLGIENILQIYLLKLKLFLQFKKFKLWQNIFKNDDIK